jgi:hypothetical protein
MADFYERGCRLEELLALWPLLRALNLTGLALGDARRACAELFEEVQSHGVERHLARLESSGDDDAKEIGRVARLLMPAWPASLVPAEAIARFEQARDRLGMAEPSGWPVLCEFAKTAAEPMPTRALLDAIRSFLPEKGPLANAAKTTFARVTVTTSRRAAGVAWSDCIFAEANAGIWPERRELSCWLGDDARRRMEREPRPFSLGLPTSETRSFHERRLYCSVARDTRRSVTFSAALFNEEDPETRLEPNAWLERVMWAKGLYSEERAGRGAFESLARSMPAPADAGPAFTAWHETWDARRDPGLPFDEYFLSEPSGAFRPRRLSASQIQAGVADPATLWFGAVLGVRRIDWRPFVRARRKTIGVLVHRVLRAALAGSPVEGAFTVIPERAVAAGRLEAELAKLRERWPADRYWESFLMDAARAARELLVQVFEMRAGGYGAVEARLPPGATVPAGEAGRIEVYGRMDLVLADMPRWQGAWVEIVDFKTGGDQPLSPVRMASSGASLQLGVYLAAAASLGATGGVSMLKPEERPSRIAAEEIESACAKLPVIGRHLVSGIYGALTPDRTEFSSHFEWPLACVPIAETILAAKFEATFGGGGALPRLEDDDE